jgi:Fe-S cluster assembly protein SufD
MLSDTAEFDAKPELEIYADDVACGHGATSGQIDEDMLFYMRQRGIPADKARSLLILAFIGEALELIENEDIRDAFQHAAEAWMGAERS